MGNKRERKGEYLFLYSACILIILLLNTGCSTTKGSQKDREGGKHLETAERLVGNGDYDGALKEYDAVSGLFPDDAPGDSALFHMGVIWAHPDNPRKDYNRASEYFQRLVRDFPGSSLKEEALVLADIIIGLRLQDSRIMEMEETLDAQEKDLAASREAGALAEEKNRELEETARSLRRQLNALKETGLETEEKNKELEETVRSLKNQLNALKEIDLGIEEKKR